MHIDVDAPRIDREVQAVHRLAGAVQHVGVRRAHRMRQHAVTHVAAVDEEVLRVARARDWPSVLRPSHAGACPALRRRLRAVPARIRPAAVAAHAPAQPAAGSASSVRPWCRTVNATEGCAAATRSTCVMQWASSVASERRNLRRAGVLWNRSATSTRIPRTPAAGCSSPAPLIDQALSASRGARDERDIGDCRYRRQRLAAKTQAIRPARGRRGCAILLVAWRVSASASSSRGMPLPLSATTMRLMPPPSRRTSIWVAPASRLFSSSSLTTEAGRSTTSPAAIWLISSSSRGRIGSAQFRLSCGRIIGTGGDCPPVDRRRRRV